jgi:hypothetical protein
VREEHGCDALVVGEQVALGDAVVREEDAFGAAEVDGRDAPEAIEPRARYGCWASLPPRGR